MTELSQLKMDSLAYSSMNQLEAVEARKFKHFRQILLFYFIFEAHSTHTHDIKKTKLNFIKYHDRFTTVLFNPFSDQG